MESKDYWDKKIIEWEDSMGSENKVSFIENLAGKFRKPLKVRSQMCFDIVKGLAKNKKVVELGCGSGYFSMRLFQEVKPKKIIGIDISPKAIERANILRKEMHLPNTISFEVGNVPATMPPSADITVGLGFLDYLNPSEITELFKNMKTKYFVFTFSEKKPALLRYIHILYLLSQRCPKHYYYTRKEMRSFIGNSFSNLKIISGPQLSFGCIIHNLPDKF